MTSVNDSFTTIAVVVVIVIIIVIIQKFELLYSGGNFDNVKPAVMQRIVAITLFAQYLDFLGWNYGERPVRA